MNKTLFTKVCCGNTSKTVAERSGPPIEVVTPETNVKSHGRVLGDRRLGVDEIVEVIGRSWKSLGAAFALN